MGVSSIIDRRRGNAVVAAAALLVVSILVLPVPGATMIGSGGTSRGMVPISQQFNGTNLTDLISPSVSFRFIRSSQNIEENRFNSLSDIFFYVSIMDRTGALPGIPSAKHDELVTTVQSFQNRDGGFGDWLQDRSKAGSTRRALETLQILNATPLNSTGTVVFLGRLQVSGLDYGNYGFRSSVKDTDADVTSTYNVIKALTLLNASVPNRTDVVLYLRDHQNFDGGFGYQTNREAGIIWPSTVVHTVRGLQALDILGDLPDFEDEAVDFVTGLQVTEGGFSNIEGGTAWISYTYNAIISLRLLGETVPRTEDIESFVMSNQLESGGFIEHALDDREGIHSTHYATAVLDLIGATYNAATITDFVGAHLTGRLDGGFGEYPGIASTMRVTFDAVSALNLIGREPADPRAVVDYVDGLGNADGGYGEYGSSNIESTYRAILTLRLLGSEPRDAVMTMDFLRSCQNNDGGFGFSDGYVSRGAYTYRAIRALDLLGVTPFNVDGAIAYIRSLQNDDDGFGNYFDEGDSDLGSTYRAVRGLAILGSSPVRTNGAEEFILGSRNPDGGFRRSPSDTTAPNNFSRSYYTYDAVLALHFLGRPVEDPVPVYDFVKSLRNPDLGYATNPFFTSKVSSTFTSLWTLHYLVDGFNTAPSLTNGSVSVPPPNATGPANFSVHFQDAEGQHPEFMHLVLDGTRHQMGPSGVNGSTHIYALEVQLAVGDHEYSFETTDGLETTSTGTMTVSVDPVGSVPTLSLEVDENEGTSETAFGFTIRYSDTDGDAPEFVRIQIADSGWVEVTGDGSTYSHVMTLSSGNLSIVAWTSDGTNNVRSDPVEVRVHTLSASKPYWETFLTIRATVLDHSGTEIAYDDVELTTYRGDLAWKVQVDGGEVLVTYDGMEVIDGDDEAGDDHTTTIAVVVIVIIAVAASVLLIRRSRDKGQGVRK